MADFMSPERQFAAEIDLERVARVVVHKDFHNGTANPATGT
ncbi:hypothetical protein [Bradyrhizobium uaiense]|nr:hypothetical protein [Bradyrhizobium uaiense]